MVDFSNKSYKSLIRKEAQRIGFSHCGFSKAEFLENEAPRLERWLNEKKHGEDRVAARIRIHTNETTVHAMHEHVHIDCNFINALRFSQHYKDC